MFLNKRLISETIVTEECIQFTGLTAFVGEMTACWVMDGTSLSNRSHAERKELALNLSDPFLLMK